MNRAYADREVVLRVAVPAALSAGIRTPPLIVFDDSRDVVNAPVTVYARVDAPSLHGTGWDVADPRFVRAARETGHEFAHLHLTVTDVPDPLGWFEVRNLPDAREGVEAAAVAGRVDRTTADWAIRLLTRTAALSRPAPRFLHGDAQPGNLLVHPDGSLAALIDWGTRGGRTRPSTFPPCRPSPPHTPSPPTVSWLPASSARGRRAHILEVHLNMAFRRLSRPPTSREL